MEIGVIGRQSLDGSRRQFRRPVHLPWRRTGCSESICRGERRADPRLERDCIPSEEPVERGACGERSNGAKGQRADGTREI